MPLIRRVVAKQLLLLLSDYAADCLMMLVTRFVGEVNTIC